MLRDQQELLVALLTDASARESCRQHTAAPPLATLYQRLPQAQLHRYAEGLLQKRWRAVRSVCPLTAKSAPDLEQRYIEWLSTHPAQATDDDFSYGLTEAMRALPAMRQQLRQANDVPPYIADLMAFELLRRCSLADGQPRFLRASYRIDRIAKALKADETPSYELAPTRFRFEAHRLLWKSLDA